MTPRLNGRGPDHEPNGNGPVALARPSAAPGELQCSTAINILVIDDDGAICTLIAAALSRDDFTIETESDPRQVLLRLRENKFHLIILDYVLPGLDSESVLKTLQEHQTEASVIVVTGHPSVESVTQCLRARTYDYLTKPFQVAHLRDVVMRCLEDKGLLRMTEKALRESLGAAIRERRKSLGLTLAQMAERTEVSLGYLSQIELGKNSASIETLYRICLALGIKLAELFQAVQRSN
jgi:DNA-binding response OmpR family regulator